MKHFAVSIHNIETAAKRTVANYYVRAKDTHGAIRKAAEKYDDYKDKVYENEKAIEFRVKILKE